MISTRLLGCILLILPLSFPGLVSAQIKGPFPKQAKGLMFSIDGSGGGSNLTTNIWHEIVRNKLPWVLERINWSRFSSAPKDHNDMQGQLLAAGKLAAKAQKFRAAEPDKQIIIIAFSTGCHVALKGAAMMPPDSVERMILFAPSVSSTYDLSGALRASKNGIDVYYSHEDAQLNVAAGTCGTADGVYGPVSGQVGFWIQPNNPNLDIYKKRLRQHPWVTAVQWTGNVGDHSGWLERKFLRAYIVPGLR